jgi:hypothetical protein
MAFIIYASNRKAKVLLKHLKTKGLIVEETDLPEYLITIRDPSPYIPAELKNSVRVKEFQGRFADFLKDAGKLGRILFKKEYSAGDVVKIKSGVYEGFVGIVKKVNKNIEVEISVFGKIVVEEFREEQLEKLATGY